MLVVLLHTSVDGRSQHVRMLRPWLLEVNLSPSMQALGHGSEVPSSIATGMQKQESLETVEWTHHRTKTAKPYMQELGGNGPPETLKGPVWT